MSDTNWKDLRKNAMTVLTGEFPVVIVKAEASKSQNGKPMIKGAVKITSGQYVGREIRMQMTLSGDNPVAVKMFFLNLEVLGLGEAYFDADPPFTQVAADLIGREAIAVLSENEWNGVKSEQIKSWKAPLTGIQAMGSPSLAVAGLGTAQPLGAPTAVLAQVITSTPSPADEDNPF